MPIVTDLDAYDRKILASLTEDGRLSWRDLSDKIGLSITPTSRRVKILEENGIITGYSAILDERRLVGSVIAFVSITLEKQNTEVQVAFESAVSRMTEVMSGFMMAGGSDYLLRVVVRDLDQYRSLLEDLMRLPGVAHVQSSFALKAFVMRPTPMIS